MTPSPEKPMEFLKEYERIKEKQEKFEAETGISYPPAFTSLKFPAKPSDERIWRHLRKKCFDRQKI